MATAMMCFEMGTVHNCGKQHVCCWMSMPTLRSNQYGVAVIGLANGSRKDEKTYRVTEMGKPDRFGNEHWLFEALDGGEYTVVVRRGEFGFEAIHCECPDHKHRNRTCKHMMALECLRQDVQEEHDNF